MAKNRWALTIFVLSLLGIAPIWMVARMPLLDYPNHLARNFVLFHLTDPQYHFAQWFRADWGLYPYVGMDILIVNLQRFVGIETAGRIFGSLCVVSLPLSVLFLLSRPGLEKNNELQFRYFHDKLLSAAAVPVHGFSYGFDNFAMLVLVVCVIIAYWRNPEFKWNGAWRFVLPALFAFYWLLPLSWGQTFDIDIRLLPALLILVLATAKIGRRQ